MSSAAKLLFSAALGRRLPVPVRRGVLVIEPPNFLEVDRRLRQLQVHIIHGVGDDLRYGEIAKPFVIGRNDKPRRVFGRTSGQRGLECIDIVAP